MKPVASNGESIRRDRMVRELQAQGIRHGGVLDALRQVPRERFVDEALRGKAYRTDASLPIGDKQTISQPWIVARMTELLEPDGKGRVLDVGTGSGYHAAILSSVFEQVYSVERLPELSRKARRLIRELEIENVHFKIFDGSYGWSEFAPYRGIVVTAAAPEVPEPLVRQLDDGGILVLPIGGDAAGERDQELVRVRRRGDKVEQENLGPCRFVPLVGKYGWSQPRR
jgi:protein-L-isoaspartate(D-aspartate) O-methyltransferase